MGLKLFKSTPINYLSIQKYFMAVWDCVGIGAIYQGIFQNFRGNAGKREMIVVNQSAPKKERRVRDFYVSSFNDGLS